MMSGEKQTQLRKGECSLGMATDPTVPSTKSARTQIQRSMSRKIATQDSRRFGMTRVSPPSAAQGTEMPPRTGGESCGLEDSRPLGSPIAPLWKHFRYRYEV